MEPFITKDGREIPLRAVGRRWVQQVLSRHEFPEHPHYVATTVAGVEEKHPHDETTLTTPEDYKEWGEWQAETRRVQVERTKGVTDFLLFECVGLEPDEWKTDLALHGFELPDPEDKITYKRFWIENELVPDVDDMAGLLARLYVIGGLVEEDRVEEFESFFRLTVARLSALEAERPAAREEKAEGA